MLVSGCVAPAQTVRPACPPCAEPSGAEPAQAVRAVARAFVAAAEPRGAGFVSRLKASFEAPVSIVGERATISLGTERQVRLVLEQAAWKIDSLDAAAQ